MGAKLAEKCRCGSVIHERKEKENAEPNEFKICFMLLVDGTGAWLIVKRRGETSVVPAAAAVAPQWRGAADAIILARKD